MDELLESNPELLVQGLIACQAAQAGLEIAELCGLKQEVHIEVSNYTEPSQILS